MGGGRPRAVGAAGARGGGRIERPDQGREHTHCAGGGCHRRDARGTHSLPSFLSQDIRPGEGGARVVAGCPTRAYDCPRRTAAAHSIERGKRGQRIRRSSMGSLIVNQHSLGASRGVRVEIWLRQVGLQYTRSRRRFSKRPPQRLHRPVGRFPDARQANCQHNAVRRSGQATTIPTGHEVVHPTE